MIPNSSVSKLLEFCITKGSVDESVEVSKQGYKAAEVLIKAKGKDIASKMLEILQKFTDNADNYQLESVNNAVLLTGVLSDFLVETGQKKLQSSFDKMMIILFKKGNKHEMIKRSVCKTIPKISRFFKHEKM